MSDFEDLLRRAVQERAAGVRTAPDATDVGRRIRRAERSAARAQRAAFVGALVIVAGSLGGVLGAVANRPAGVPLQQASSPASPDGGSPTAGTGAALDGPKGAHDHAATEPAVTAAPAAPAVHRADFGGVTVAWLLDTAMQPVEVVAGAGSQPTCSRVALASVTIGDTTPVASGSGAVGLPALQPEGLAVVSSGTFSAPDRAPGWWAMLEGGSSATDVAVQFPTGAVVRAPVSSDGVAVVAAVAPAGATLADYSQYGSAVADGPTRAMGSLEFLFGGGIAAVDAADGPSGPASAASGTSGAGEQPLAACELDSAAAGAASALARTAGPPAAMAAAGDVVAAYAQAYDVNPLLGLTWNLTAVDLGSALGCPSATIDVPGTSPVDGLALPAVQVEAVVFTGASSAVVVYQRAGRTLLETGTAELVDGSWKVGAGAYCEDMKATAP